VLSRLLSSRRIRHLFSRFRVTYKKYASRDLSLGSNITIGKQVVFETHRALKGKSSISIGDECEIEAGVRLEAWGGHIHLERNVFVGPQTIIYGHGGVDIGEDTLISMQCKILSSNHSIPPTSVRVRSMPDILLPTRIGKDVWLGAGVTILGGVTIEDGAVIGAGAVVTRNIPAFSIAYGVPAKVVGSRVN